MIKIRREKTKDLVLIKTINYNDADLYVFLDKNGDVYIESMLDKIDESNVENMVLDFIKYDFEEGFLKEFGEINCELMRIENFKYIKGE